MMGYSWTAIVTIVALLVYIGLGIQVATARGKSEIKAPAMTGHPLLERANRVHMNTLEWLPVFVVGLWLFAAAWNDKVAAGLGVVWIVGRLLYSRGYMADPDKRSTGYLIQALTCLVLLFGALGKIIYTMVVAG